jgi:ribosome-binding protein aMBF1 (putative translation factor)
MSNFQDWKPVVLKKQSSPPKQNPQQQNSSIKMTTEALDVDNKPIKLFDKEFGQKIARLRNIDPEKKMDQKQLAVKLNVQPQVIAGIENGTGKYNGELVNKLKRLFGPENF